ncbi:hypothetical protein GCM10023166_15570 [Paeniglutamicibacter cryotolerans]
MRWLYPLDCSPQTHTSVVGFLDETVVFESHMASRPQSGELAEWPPKMDVINEAFEGLVSRNGDAHYVDSRGWRWPVILTSGGSWFSVRK